jgi:hypothetical protein
MATGREGWVFCKRGQRRKAWIRETYCDLRVKPRVVEAAVTVWTGALRGRYSIYTHGLLRPLVDLNTSGGLNL